MSDLSTLSVAQLKEILKQHQLVTAGTKAELIARLMEADPSGGWTADQACIGRGGRSDEDVSRDVLQREMEVNRRELELAQRELMLARREIAVLRERHDADRREETAHASASTLPHPRGAIAIAELLAEFNGSTSTFDVWEKQIRLLKMTYHLNDDQMKILIGMRLKGKALSWFHSKPDFITMRFDDVMKELRVMFGHRQDKVAARRKFEARSWRRDETFHEYVHEKVIMGNHVPIGDDEMTSYIIDGIPDSTLRNQARIQRFVDMETFLEAFEGVTLRDFQPASSRRSDKRDGRTHPQPERKSGNGGDKKGTSANRCFNCGMKDHISTNCPSKSLGSKCFGCGEFGHIAARCTKKAGAPESLCTMTRVSQKKYIKSVVIDGNRLEALIDTGSDISLMRADEYIKIGSPRFRANSIRFSGIGSDGMTTTLGEFQAEITIDEHTYPILIRVVSDTVSRQRLLIGTDFLDTVEVHVRRGTITINPIDESSASGNDIPNVLQIDVENMVEADAVDVSHLQDIEYRQAVTALIENYRPNKVREPNITMTIVLKDDEPVYQRARRLSPVEKDIVNRQIEEWEKEGIVRPSSSDYASPVVLVKKRDGSNRLCVDYRSLNKKIIKDRYPLPLIEDQLDMLQDAKYFSTIDLKNGFFHVKVDETSVKYTAFVVPDGQYEFLRVPFGLCNSPSVFQRYVNAIFKDLMKERIVLVYMDDLIVLSSDCASGLRNLERVLDVASKAGLLMNWKKCRFLESTVEFLGYVISCGRVQPSERKVEAVKRFREPQNVRQVQAFLGLTGYFRKFIPKYAIIARPLSNLLRAGVRFCFEVAERDAFQRLKVLLSERPVLGLYRIGAETELHTDASMHGYGAILLQRNSDDRLLHPIYYASGKTTPAEEKYTSYELEVLAIIKALKRFRVYLLGIPFKIVTDCRAFTLTMTKRDLCVRVARWALALEEFHYVIEHRPGKAMLHADALSRNPLPISLAIDECEAGLTSRLKKAQSEDDDLKEIIDAVKQGKSDGYVLRGGLLYKEIDDDVRLVVPRAMQSQIIRKAHEQGHFAASKVEAVLRKNYWISGLRAKIEAIVRNCISCILAERKRGRMEGLLNPIEKGGVPFDTFHVDHLGPLPSTRKSYAHIFAVIDSFSKFVWLYATKSTGVAEVIGHLGKQSVNFGNPRRIVSDRGSAFTSREFVEYCRAENIEHSLTTVGVPRANGQVERLNRTLIPLLTKLSAPVPGEWHKYLGVAQQCLNVTLHRGTRMTPFYLLFGVCARVRDNPDLREFLEDERIAMFCDDRDELRDQARENIRKMQEENKKTYNRKRKGAFCYREGDLVAIKRMQRGPGLKLADKYLGPYEVIAVLRNDRYLVHKVGEHEGPSRTSSAAEFMKPWIESDDDLFSDAEDDEIGEHSK